MTHYETLNLKEDATTEEIKKTYRSLMMQYHPDRHQDNPLMHLANEKVIGIQRAYEVLGNLEKRTLYDTELYRERNPFRPRTPEPPKPTQPTWSNFDEDEIEEETIFEETFDHDTETWENEEDDDYDDEIEDEAFDYYDRLRKELIWIFYSGVGGMALLRSVQGFVPAVIFMYIARFVWAIRKILRGK